MGKSKANWEIVEELVLLEENINGWKKELNLIRWYGEEPKYDIRWWHPERTKCMKGITFSEEEMDNLHSFLNQRKEKVCG